MCIRDRCKAAAAAGNFDISAAEIIDPENYAGFDEMVNTMVCLLYTSRLSGSLAQWMRWIGSPFCSALTASRFISVDLPQPGPLLMKMCIRDSPHPAGLLSLLRLQRRPLQGDEGAA